MKNNTNRQFTAVSLICITALIQFACNKNKGNISTDNSIPIYLIANSNLNLRSEPNKFSKSIKLLSVGEILLKLKNTEIKENIEGNDGFWVLVKCFDESEGYVFEGFTDKFHNQDFTVAYAQNERTLLNSDALFQITVNENLFQILLDQSDERIAIKNMKKINLRNKADGFITKLEYTFVGPYIFLLYEVTDGEGGETFLTKISKNNQKVLYNTSIHGFNWSTPYFQSRYIYVSSIGFVGKIDFHTGQYVWKHKNLYQDDYFNSFSSVNIKDGIVSYLSKSKHDTNRMSSVNVDDKSGKLISVIKL